MSRLDPAVSGVARRCSAGRGSARCGMARLGMGTNGAFYFSSSTQSERTPMSATVFIRKARDISKELATLIDETKALERGSFIPHDTIERVSGIDRRRDAATYNR